MKGSLFKLDWVAPLITDSPLASSTMLSKKEKKYIFFLNKGFSFNMRFKIFCLQAQLHNHTFKPKSN